MSRIRFRIVLALAAAVFAGILAACAGGDDSPTATPLTFDTGNPGPPLATFQISASSTQTVAPTPVGTDNGLCTATASVSIATPATTSYTQTFTGVLTCNGISPQGATMHAVWHEKKTDKTCDGTADATGTATCCRPIGALTVGYQVVINVTFGLNGAAYATATSFTPR